PSLGPDALALSVAGAASVWTPDAALPLGEGAALLGDVLGGDLALLVDEPHHLAAQRGRLGRVVRDAEPDQHIGPAHHAQPDPADTLRERGDLRQRVVVGIDHIVEEARALVRHLAQSVPVDLALLGYELAEVDRAEVTYVVCEERLFAALPCDQTVKDHS